MLVKLSAADCAIDVELLVGYERRRLRARHWTQTGF